MLTSIVVLTYNKLDYTKQCIDSIRQYTTPDTYELIVVDNASTDGTVEWLEEQTDIRKIYNDSNLGFPKGCNQGIEISTGDSVLLLNNDTIVTHQWLSNMRTALFSAPDIGAVGTVTNSCSNYQAIPATYKSLEEMQKFARDHNVSSPQMWEERCKLIGYNLLIKKEVIDKIGYLDEIFSPGNFEDDDYSYRIRGAGYKLLLCKDTFIHHYGSASFSDDASGYRQLLLTNQQKFIDKWGFHPELLTTIRKDLVDLIGQPKDRSFRVLEIGCGGGGTLMEIKNRFPHAELYGIEKDPHAAESTAIFANISVSDIYSSTLSYPAKYFDVLIVNPRIYLNNSLEILNHLVQYLKDGGQLIGSARNLQHYMLVHKLLKSNITNEHIGAVCYENVMDYFNNANFKNHNITGLTLKHDGDEFFIQELVRLSGKADPKRFEIEQFVFNATLRHKDDEMVHIFKNISNQHEVQKQIEGLIKYDSEEMIEGILNFYENKVFALNFIAVHLLEMGVHDKAFACLNKAFELDSFDQNTKTHMAMALYAMGQKELALEWFQTVENKDEHIEAWIEKIRNEAQPVAIETKEEQIKRYLRRIEFDIDTTNSFQKISEIMKEGYTEESLLQIVDLHIADKVKVLNALSVMLFEEGLHDLIIPVLEKALVYNPQDDLTLYNLGYFMMELQEWKLALAYFEQITNKDDHVVQAIMELKGALHQ